jgi:hypothetical protein
MTDAAKDRYIRDFRMIRRAMASDRYDPEAIEYVDQLDDARRHLLCELYLVANSMPAEMLSPRRETEKPKKLTG